MIADKGGVGGAEMTANVAFKYVSGLPATLDEPSCVEVPGGLVGVPGQAETAQASAEGVMAIHSAGQGGAKAEHGVCMAEEAVEPAFDAIEGGGEVVAGVQTGGDQKYAVNRLAGLEVLNGPNDKACAGRYAHEVDRPIGVGIVIALDAAGQLDGFTEILLHVHLVVKDVVAGPGEILEGIGDAAFV